MGTYTYTTTRLTGDLPGPGDRDHLVLEHLPQIKRVARRISVSLPKHVDVQDLEGAGALGLIDAARKYNPSRGVKFKTYAETRIRGAILDSLREEDWAPRSLRRKGKRLEAAYSQLEQRLGRRPSDDEVCSEMGISMNKFHKMLNGVNCGPVTNLPTLETHTDAFETEMLPHALPNLRPLSPADVLLSSELRSILARAIDGLPKKQRLVVSLYYYEQLSLKEIGAILGVNESRASQYHARAKENLRTLLKKVRTAA